MDERDFAGLLDALYDAATNLRRWEDFGDQLCARFAADRAYLGIPRGDGTLPNLLRSADPLDALYAEHFHTIDPFRLGATAAAQHGPVAPYVVLGERIATKEALRSQYYGDYAQRRGTRHSLGVQIDAHGQTLLGLFRESRIGGFTSHDLRAMTALLPHLRRGLQVSNTLAAALAPSHTPSHARSGAGLAALDGLPMCVIVVDGAMGVTFANAAAERLTADNRSGLRLIRSGLSGPGRSTQLASSRTNDATTLKRLVASAAANGPGGALRLRSSQQAAIHGGDAGRHATAVLVSPLPARLATVQPAAAPQRLARGLALVVASNIMTAKPPPLRLLRELFGLSPGEAAVASLVLGGATTDTVARLRHVSPDTVRRQIQTVLRKTEAANLRDFERIAALLALMQPDRAHTTGAAASHAANHGTTAEA